MKKTCSVCRQLKDEATEFYCYKGNYRGNCKTCHVKKSVIYQRENETWKNKFIDDEHRVHYLRDYYAKNKEKFAEYRRIYKEKHPDYHKDYARKRKNPQK